MRTTHKQPGVHRLEGLRQRVREPKKSIMLIFMVLFAVFGIVYIISSHAAGPSPALEAELGTKSANITTLSDPTASGGSAVQFKAVATTGPGTSSCASYAAPITITTGGTYSGQCWQSTDSATPAVTINTSAPVVIQNCTIKGAGKLIYTSAAGADITIHGCYGEGTSATSESRFFGAEFNFKRVIIENNYLVRTAGIYFNTGNPTEIKVRYNQAREITTKIDAQYYVQFVQFNNVNGGDVDVSWNEIINTPGNSKVEDNISIYASGGVSTKRWLVHDNLVWGAFPNPNPTTASFSGGGIMHGDNSGGWTETYSNVVLGTTNYGIAIVGGTGFYVHDNTVLSCGCTSTGAGITATNVGAYITNYSPLSNSSLVNNKVGWWKPVQQSRNDFWFPNPPVDGVSVSQSGNTQFGSGAINYSAEQAEYATWQQRVTTAGVHLGP
jgi:hypothetical protein